ncbi:MAG: S8 family serine peptidase [Balneolaceae bacterium]
MSGKLFRAIAGVLLLAIIGIYGCEQPTEQISQEEQEETNVLPEHGEVVDGEYIVVFRDDKFDKGKAAAHQVKEVRSSLLTDYSISADAVKHEFNVALRGFSAELDQRQLEQLRNDSRVDYIEKDRVVTLAPPWEDDDGDDNSEEQETPWGIERVGGAVDYAGENVAWIIDTGIDLDHPDLNVDEGLSEVFVARGPGSNSPDDGNGHGTHVAGTVAALDNDIDVVGVAAGATVVAVKVLDNRGSGQYSWVIEGIDYVAENGSPGDVANLSLGGPTSDAMDDAVRNAADEGVLFTIAAGNDGEDANNYSPARVEYDNVWTVSAFDDADTFASFSNWSGPADPPIEYGEPGVDILSLAEGGGTTTLSGTSMAAPHLAGILLATGGTVDSDGTVSDDPDGDPDPVGVH